MKDKEAVLTKKIIDEYLRFMKESRKLHEEVKRATILSLKEILKLKDGDTISISSDGSYEIQKS